MEQKYYIVRVSREIKNYDDITEGCTMLVSNDPERVMECDNYTHAMFELDERETTICEFKDFAGIKRYMVIEYWIEVVTLDEDGEEIDWEYPEVTEM